MQKIISNAKTIIHMQNNSTNAKTNKQETISY